MKKMIVLLMILYLWVSVFTGCAAGDPKETDKSAADTKHESTALTVSGQLYDTGEFCALVPEGWAAFPITDAFSENGAVDTTCFNIIKGGSSDLDLFSKPYVRFDYYGPDTMMMKPGSEYYENVKEIAPTQLGSHLWSGFTGEDGYGKSAVLWAEEGDIQYQAIIWLEAGGLSISLEDEDVQAILASVSPSDGSGKSNGGGGSSDGANEIVSGINYDGWEGEWYGWWMLKNGTGVFAPATDIAWDAFAQIDVHNDSTASMKLWDTGTTRDEVLIYVYDISFESGDSPLGRMISKRVDFFPYGCWNNGMEAVTMSERSVGWTIDPANSTVSHFENMLEIIGHYESPENAGDSFDYYIYLRPWGTLWEDVRNGDTSGCLYKDMMPIYYDNWYVSLLNLGFEHPTVTFQEGIDVINDYLASQQSGSGTLDPAAKEGADGKVSMAKLKEMLEWCKKDTSYVTTYEEIAAKFGVHGRKKVSLFENITIYQWLATEDDYIQISFDVHEDGSETWNVTQWQGIE